MHMRAERAQQEWVEVATFSSLFEAEMAKSNLEAYSISAFIEKDDCGGMNPGLAFSSGVRLLVTKSRLAAAKECLGLK
jgi:hypothetical protein